MQSSTKRHLIPSPSKLGWCLDDHHASCWRVSVSGTYCMCQCHRNEDGTPKSVDPSAATPEGLVPYLTERIQAILANPEEEEVQSSLTDDTVTDSGDSADTESSVMTMTESMPEQAPAAESFTVPDVPTVPSSDTTQEIDPAPAKAPKTGGTSTAAMAQMSREELTMRRARHVKNAAKPGKTAEWHAKQVTKIDAILTTMPEATSSDEDTADSGAEKPEQ